MESHEEDLREVFVECSAPQGFPELQEIYGNVGKSVPESQHSISQMMQVSSISRTCALSALQMSSVRRRQTFSTGQKYTCCSRVNINMKPSGEPDR